MINILDVRDLIPMMGKFFEKKECFPISYVKAKPSKEGKFDCYYKFRCNLSEMSVTVEALSGVDIYSGGCMYYDGHVDIKSFSEFLQRIRSCGL